MTPIRRLRAISIRLLPLTSMRKVVRVVVVLSLAATVLTAVASSSSASTTKKLVPSLSSQAGASAQGTVTPPSPVSGSVAPGADGAAAAAVAPAETQTGPLRVKTIAEWNAAGRYFCAILGCTWLATTDPLDKCEVHHIIATNQPITLGAQYYAALGGFGNEDLSNGVYLTYAGHKTTFPSAYLYAQEAEFEAFANLPNGRTPAAEKFYTGNYLAAEKNRLYTQPYPLGGCPGYVSYP